MVLTIRIVTWNANGLLNQIPELEIFLNSEKIDICLISETHFTRLSYVKIRGYKIYHAIHPENKARGGSAVLVKESIKHHEETKIEEDIMQVATIQIQFNKNKKYNISAIYCPPRHNIKKEDYIRLMKSLGDHFIIGGDYNAKNTHWGSRLTNPKGRELYTAGSSLNCNFLSGGKPTYWPTDTNKIPDLIDFFVTKGISNNFIHIENDENLISDHTAVIMNISDTIINKETIPRLTNNKTNWNLFRQLVENKINLQVPMRKPYQLEEELDQFNIAIQLAAWKSTPQRQNKKIENITYSSEIRDLVQQKRKARKLWQRHRAPQLKTVLNHLCNQLKSLIKETKNEAINKFLRELSAQKETDYSLWKATKGLKRPIIQVPPIKNEKGCWIRNPKEKAELFASHLEETFQPNSRLTADENVTIVTKTDEVNIRPVSMQELNYEIQNNLNPKKAPGYDLITGQIIKELPQKGVRKLLYLINAAIRLKHIPKQWKVAEVMMILKPGKPPNDKKSYRPISLLPIISKLFEKLLLKRLKLIIEERNLIPTHQFGFREKHSTVEQVHRITNIIEKSLEEKKICAAVFLDVAQAFDKVWHKGLEYKLHRDLPRQYYLILKSYLADRYFRVKYEEEYSNLKVIKAGVPQGSVLGPILYLLYTRDLPIMEEGLVATFADDTAILSSGSNAELATNQLQNSVSKVSLWTKKWRIKLNESKSTHIYFTNKNVEYKPVMINETQIPYANTAKYLGMTLDTKLKWKEHVKKKQQELNIKFRKMYWLLGRNSELSIHNKLLIYRQMLKPIWTYGIQLWGCTKKTNIQVIQTFQNKVLRCIVNAPWYIRNDNLHRDLNMEQVKDEIKKHAVKHENRLRQHVNAEVRHLLDTTMVVRRLQRKKPMDLVDDNFGN